MRLHLLNHSKVTHTVWWWVQGETTPQRCIFYNLPSVTVPPGAEVVTPIVQARLGPAGGSAYRSWVPILLWVDRPPTYGARAAMDAAAEACAVRYGAARVPFTPVVDGDLSEWPRTGWSVVGYPVQERGWWGPTKLRSKPSDGWLEWAMAGDKDYVYLAARVQDKVVGREALTLFFDPRPPGVLGTCGTYYWAGVQLLPDGKVALSPGETTRFFAGAVGAWKRTAQGWDLELRLPYRALGCQEWPPSGDLGFSLVWTHAEGGAGTHYQLYWAEDGQYWCPRWYGVVRRVSGDADLARLPWRVRWR